MLSLRTRGKLIWVEFLRSTGNDQELENVLVFGNTMDITLIGCEDPLSVEILGQNLHEMNASFNDITLKIKQAKEISVLTAIGGETE